MTTTPNALNTRAANEVKRVALYARVSTKKLNAAGEREQDPEMQLADLRRYALAVGWEIVAEFVDEGVSGSKSSRPQLNRLMEGSKSGAFDVVMVWKFDRFARSSTHLLTALETFQKLGVAFVSKSEQFDTSSPAGKMMFSMLAAMAEFERALIAERVKAGMKHAKDNGATFGPDALAVNVDALQSLQKAGKSSREIAAELNVSASTIQRRMRKAA